MVFCQFYKKIERSVPLILVILGNLVHFRHLFIVLYQSVTTKGCYEDKYDKVEIVTITQTGRRAKNVYLC